MMYKSKVSMAIPAVVVSAILLSILACETPQDNSIEQARQCSDNASQLAATNSVLAASIAANTCEPLIQNIQTAEAGLIGGGLVLLEEQKLSNLTSIETAVNAGSGAVATSISFLVFTSQSDVNRMAYYAALSADPGTIELANIVSLAYFANAAAVIAGGSITTGTTTAQLTTFLTDLSSDNTNGPPAAQAVLSAEANACSGGSTSSLCTELTKAINGATTYGAIFTNIAAYVNSGG